MLCICVNMYQYHYSSKISDYILVFQFERHSIIISLKHYLDVEGLSILLSVYDQVIIKHFKFSCISTHCTKV